MTVPARRSAVTLAAALVAALVVALGLSGLTGCSKHHGSKAEFCKQLRTVPPLRDVLTGFREADAEELRTRLDTAEDTYADLRDAAPDDVRGAVDQVVDLVDEVIAAVRAHPDDPDAITADVGKAVREHAEAARATRQLRTYAQQQCKVTLE